MRTRRAMHPLDLFDLEIVPFPSSGPSSSLLPVPSAHQTGVYLYRVFPADLVSLKPFLSFATAILHPTVSTLFQASPTIVDFDPYHFFS